MWKLNRGKQKKENHPGCNGWFILDELSMTCFLPMALRCQVHASKMMAEGEQASLNEVSAAHWMAPRILRTVRVAECVGTKIQNILDLFIYRLRKISFLFWMLMKTSFSESQGCFRTSKDMTRQDMTSLWQCGPWGRPDFLAGKTSKAGLNS